MDSSCFSAGSSWTISAKFRYMHNNGTDVGCVKNYQFGANSCPVFQIASGGEWGGRIPMENTDETPMVVGGWNGIKHASTIESEP